MNESGEDKVLAPSPLAAAVASSEGDVVERPVGAGLRVVPASVGPLSAASAEVLAPPSGLAFSSFYGCLSQLSSEGGGLWTVGAALILHAQERGGWPVWITSDALPFAEDLQACGIDMRGLACIRVPDAVSSFRAAEHVLRAARRTVVCVDLGRSQEAPVSAMGRLMRYAQLHDSACVFLVRGDAQSPSLSSLIHYRLALTVAQDRVVWRVLRDKRHGQRDGGVLHARVPPGMIAGEQEEWSRPYLIA